MAHINNRINALKHVLEVAESLKTCEQARIESVKAHAASLYEDSLKEYRAFKLIKNIPIAQYGAHDEYDVLAAEGAFAVERHSLAREILEVYFQYTPMRGQFYCRAKLLLALIIDVEAAMTNGAESIRQRKLALAEVLSAVKVATSEGNIIRYKFIVFNSSLICWKIVSPFLRASRAHYFTQEVNAVSNALETCDDPDIPWRISYLSAAAVCFNDDKQPKLASDLIDKAVALAEKEFAVTIEAETRIKAKVDQGLKESEKFLSAIRKFEEWDALKYRKKKIDPDAPEGAEEPPEPIPPLEGLAARGYDELKASLDAAQMEKGNADEEMRIVQATKLAQQELMTRLYMQRVQVNTADAKRISSTPQVSKSLRMRCKVELQMLASKCVPEKDWGTCIAALFKDLNAAPVTASTMETMIDVCQAAWGLPDPACHALAVTNMATVEKCAITSPSITIKLDLCKALQIVAEIPGTRVNQAVHQRLTTRETEGYGVSRRLEALKILERSILMSSKLGNNTLVEEICTAVWNTAMPLLQPHLRKRIHSALSAASHALEVIESTQTILRTWLHIELMKCEDAADFVGKAFEEGSKAIACDYGIADDALVNAPLGIITGANLELDRNRPLDHLFKPTVANLRARMDLYNPPVDVEGKVMVALQQIKESGSMRFQSEMLVKATNAMIQSVQKPPKNSDLGSEANFSVADVPLKLPDISLDELEAVVSRDRGSVAPTPAVAPTKGAPAPPPQPTVTYDEFHRLTQKRIYIMSSLASLAQTKQNSLAAQHCCHYVLSSVWNPADNLMRPLLFSQIEAHYLLADALIVRLSNLPVPYFPDEVDDPDAEPSPFHDLRALGVDCPDAGDEAIRIKQLIVKCIRRGLELAALIKDQYGMQNAIITFWNTHLHLFRSGLHSRSIPEVSEFVKVAIESLDALKAAPPTAGNQVMFIDDRLRVGMVEASCNFMLCREETSPAGELALRNCAMADLQGDDIIHGIYVRKRLCELACSALLAGAGSAAPGAKGAAKPFELPKFDHPVLSAFGLLVQAESIDVDAKDQIIATTDKLLALMNGDVAAFISKIDMPNLTQDRYDQIMEMQAEVWTRLTRLMIALGSMHGAQDAALRCMDLVSPAILREFEDEANRLSPRVWRWVSVCERYFGVAISKIIQPDGQDEMLQNELRLAALRHFTCGCTYAQKASKPDLIAAAAADGWNIALCLVTTQSTKIRNHLLTLQRQIVDTLLTCPSKMEEAVQLKQQYYLAMVHERSLEENWEAAHALVQEAFENVPTHLQKPLWRWRVIVMSKLGKNVLDGLAKLKENDPSLQARVFAILARSSTDPKQQLDGYRKTVEVLNASLERVEYILEMAQWMGSAGIYRHEIKLAILSALDSIYAVEEKQYVENVEAQSSRSTLSVVSRMASSVASRSKMSRSATGAGSVSRNGTGVGSTGSRGPSRKTASRGKTSSSTEDIDLCTELNLKHLEQGCRLLIMMAKLESTCEARKERLTEMIYFLERLQKCWMTSLTQTLKAHTYSKLSGEEQDAVAFENYQLPDEAIASIAFPQNAMDLLRWLPSDEFTTLMAKSSSDSGLHVPSKNSFNAMPLTVHYWLWAASALEKEGSSVHALFCIGMLRAVLLSLPEEAISERDAALAQAHFKAISILCKCGVEGQVKTLPTALRPQGPECHTYVQTLIARASDFQTLQASSFVGAAEKTSVFGFYTWTANMANQVDIESCAIAICESLLELGMVAQCSRLSLALLAGFTAKKNQRALLKVSTVVAQLYLLRGRARDALATIVEARGALATAGEATILAQHTVIAMKCHMQLGTFDEAKRMAGDVLDILEELSSLSSRDSGTSSPQKRVPSPMSRVASRRSVGSRSLQSHSSGSTISKTMKVVEKKEESLEAAVAIAHVAEQFADVIVTHAVQDMKLVGEEKSVDARTAYLSIMDRLTLLNDTVARVVGPDSPICATILAKKSSAAFVLLRNLHAYASRNLELDVYRRWLEDNITFAIETMQQAMDIRRFFMTGISNGQKLLIATASTGEVSVLPMNLECMRDLSFCEMQMAEQLLVLAHVRGEHQSGRKLLPPKASLSVVDRFLIETKEEKVLDDENFRLTTIHKALMLSGSAIQLQANTVFAARSDLLFNIAKVCGMCASGDFDSSWVLDSHLEEVGAPLPHTKHEAPEVDDDEYAWMVMSDDAKEARLQLGVSVVEAIQAGHFSTAAEGASTLVEAFGVRNSNNAVAWLMQQQAIASRDWLMSLWTEAQTPTCEVAFSLARLEALEANRWPSHSSQMQILVERAFLQHTSVCYRRLDVSADPASILRALPNAPNTYYMCLQFCPRQNVLYLGVGSPDEEDKKGAKKEEPFSLPGSWFLDKVVLTEEARRLIQRMRDQHIEWCDEVQTFISAYGDNIIADFDIEGAESLYRDKTLSKKERALDERFRLLLANMGQVVEPLLGEGSPAIAFLAKLLKGSEEVRQKGGAAGAKHPSLVLLIDPCLEILPWEGLPFISNLFQNACSRDYSIHMLGHRHASLSAAVSSSQISIFSSNVKTIVDPFGDDNGNTAKFCERMSMTSAVQALVSGGAGGGAKWNRITQQRGPVALQDWIAAAQSGTKAKPVTLLTLTPCKISCFLNPREMVAINLENVGLFFVSDWSQNESSYRRQNLMDNLKVQREVRNESSYRVVALMSLAGAGCVMGTMWSTAFASQSAAATQLWTEFTKKQQPLVGALAATTVRERQEGTSTPSKMPLKKWVHLSRRLYGFSHLIYSDS